VEALRFGLIPTQKSRADSQSAPIVALSYLTFYYFLVLLTTDPDAVSCIPLHPYNKLLNTLFPVDTDFTVTPDSQELNSAKGAAHLFTFEIYVENRPVFVLRLN
jgi:hypothetical protein